MYNEINLGKETLKIFGVHFEEDDDREPTWDELLSKVVNLIVENEKLKESIEYFNLLCYNRGNELGILKIKNMELKEIIQSLELEVESLKDDKENLLYELRQYREREDDLK